jgi:hypothetical protein
MDCFKLTVSEDRFGSKSSREVIMKLMREVCKELHQLPNGQTGMMFMETGVFPKVYYFITLNRPLLIKIRAKWPVESTEYPDSLLLNKEVQYLGNKNLISPKQKKA